MRKLLVLVFGLLLAAPAAAEWPTTSYVPIPAGDPPFEGLGNPDDLTVDSINRGALMQGAFAVLSDLMGLAKRDSAKLEAAGFAAPLIQPLLIDGSTGDKYFPIRWTGGFGAPAQQGCYVARNGLGMITNVLFTLEMNTGSFPYGPISTGYNAGGPRRDYVLDRISSIITHEIVHGIQNRSWKDPETCELKGVPPGNDGPLWFSEGTADGIAHYLLLSRRPAAAETYGASRNQRRWDEGLNASGMSIGNDYTYETGSFFRYLMEASESSPGDGLPILRDIIGISPSKLSSGDDLIEHIDSVVKIHARGRGLYQVLPEFMTEYGSYGVGRYKTDRFGSSQSSIPLTEERWLDKSFGGCVRFDLTPGQTVSQKVRVDALAGECIHVKWTGFKTPVAMQVFGDGKDKEYGDLHLGEAVRIDNAGKKYCYDATKGLKPRIKLLWSKKCIMRRETSDIGAKGAPPGKVAIWTTDFNLEGDGEAYFILTNVARDPNKTKEISLDFIVGAVAVESPEPDQKVVPRKRGSGNPTKDGKTDIDKRVHAMNGNEKRMMFDARTVFGQSVGLGFMEGVRDQGNFGKGLLTVVRGGNYWVGFVAAKKEIKSAAFVIKNPAAFEVTKGAAFSGGSIVGGGPLKKKGGGAQCGYDMEPDITLIEQSRTQMKYRIQVDMFDMQRAMRAGIGGGSHCDMMKKAHVEKADFTVTLPYGTLYKGDSTIERAHPPGQDLYDNEEFDQSPTLGGIETSMQLAGVSEGDTGAPDEDAPAPASGSSSGTANPVGTPGKCGCACPNVAVPDEPFCVDACRKVWDRCR